MFVFSDDACYQMPAHFGGQEGPPRPQTYRDVTTITIGYRTDGDALARLLPEPFRLAQPLVSISYGMNRGVEWLAGGGYNVVGVNVPVTYAGGAEPMDGFYALVMWENRTGPILGGREQTGIPKIYAEISDPRRQDERLAVHASYEGRAFLQLDFRQGAAMTPQELDVFNRQSGTLNWFGWRYIPNIGRPGAALSHATLYPIETLCSAGWRGEGRVDWTMLTWEQAPPQAHIIQALSKLPIEGYTDCAMSRGVQILRIDSARQLP